MRALLVLVLGAAAFAATFLPWLGPAATLEDGAVLRTWLEAPPPNWITGVVGAVLAVMAAAELAVRRFRPPRLTYAGPALGCAALTLGFIAGRAGGPEPFAIGCYLTLAAHAAIVLAALAR